MCARGKSEKVLGKKEPKKDTKKEDFMRKATSKKK